MKSSQTEETPSEVSFATSDLLLSESAMCTVTANTVSEIYPEDSVSNRNMNEAHSVNGDRSVLSLNTEAASEFYTVIGGRVFSQSEVYALPADEEEHERLDMQQFAYTLYVDSLYPFTPLVRHLLREGQASPPEVIDVGAGSGRWAIDMARTFPHVNFVGIDIVPPAKLEKAEIPGNCRFEIDDMNQSMDHFEGTFTIVHARLIEGSLNDPESFQYEMARIMKPGGLFLLGNADVQFHDENKQPFPFVEPGQPGFSWPQYLVGHVYRAYIARGGAGGNAYLFWKEWLEENPNFSEVYEEEVYVPLGPWQEGLDERQRLAANFMRENIARVCIAFRRVLLEGGCSEEDVTTWTEGAVDALKKMSPRGYHRFRYIGAVRSNTPWQERPMRATPQDLTTRSLIEGIDLKSPWVRGSC